MTSENRLQNAGFRRSTYLIYYCSRLLILISSLPSRQTLLIGNGITIGGFLRIGSYRVTAREVIVVDNEVMVIIDADRAGAVGVVEGAEGILYILYDRFLDLA